jgi:hypothetical protein
MGRKSEGCAVRGGMNTISGAAQGAPVFAFVAIRTPGATSEPVEGVAVRDSITVAARHPGSLEDEDSRLPADEALHGAVARFVVFFGRASSQK